VCGHHVRFLNTGQYQGLADDLSHSMEYPYGPANGAPHSMLYTRGARATPQAPSQNNNSIQNNMMVNKNFRQYRSHVA
jgi:hypothetical protein